MNSFFRCIWSRVLCSLLPLSYTSSFYHCHTRPQLPLSHTSSFYHCHTRHPSVPCCHCLARPLLSLSYTSPAAIVPYVALLPLSYTSPFCPLLPLPRTSLRGVAMQRRLNLSSLRTFTGFFCKDLWLLSAAGNDAG